MSPRNCEVFWTITGNVDFSPALGVRRRVEEILQQRLNTPVVSVTTKVSFHYNCSNCIYWSLAGKCCTLYLSLYGKLYIACLCGVSSYHSLWNVMMESGHVDHDLWVQYTINSSSKVGLILFNSSHKTHVLGWQTTLFSVSVGWLVRK